MEMFAEGKFAPKPILRSLLQPVLMFAPLARMFVPNMRISEPMP